MSPLSLRRFRADRLLREEFDRLRDEVLPALRSKLLARGVRVDGADLEAFYAQAWQGLYATVLAGEEISNPAGWLVLVAFRRAIDEHRRGAIVDPEPLQDGRSSLERPGEERDIAGELDDRASLRRLLEGMSVSLSQREREAASLCYLQGFSRREAARHLGISERKMERLMDGRGPGRRGVASKLGVLTAAIAEGRYCEERASLMRAFAFGILDREGERYKLALAHRRDCPACRAYVRSLRGISALLPPVLLRVPAAAVLRSGGAGAAGVAGGTGGGGGSVAGATTGGVSGVKPGSAASGAGASAAGGASTGGVSGGAAASFGGSGISGWLGASVGAKLAVAGAAALVLGGGVYALSSSSPGRREPNARTGPTRAAGRFPSSASLVSGAGSILSSSGARRRKSGGPRSRPPGRRGSPGSATARGRSVATPFALREFGFEKGTASTGAGGGSAESGAASGESAVRPSASGSAQREFGIE